VCVCVCAYIHIKACHYIPLFTFHFDMCNVWLMQHLLCGIDWRTDTVKLLNDFHVCRERDCQSQLCFKVYYHIILL
jgi:hypothetical protein